MINKFVLRFLIFSVSLFVVGETVCRIFIDHRYFKQTNLYRNVNERDTVDYIFIGSSRTAGSIVPEVFSGGPHEISINAGRGYSTAQTQYRALRYLLRRNPDVLRNCSVFIEAPGGQCYTENGKEWVYEGNTQMLIPYLNQDDLTEFLRQSRDPFKTKADVVILYYSAAWRGSYFIREKTDRRLTDVLNKADEILSGEKSGNAYNTDLKGEGGIKQDSASVAEVRKFAYYIVPHDINLQTLLSTSDMDSSMLARIHQLVTRAGGHVYLFDTPLSTLIHQIYETDISATNKILFDRWIESHNIPVITATFDYADEDFPDLFHLKASRSEEYTDSLRIAYTHYLNHNQISAVINN